MHDGHPGVRTELRRAAVRHGCTVDTGAADQPGRPVRLPRAHAGQVSAAHESQVVAQVQADQALANGQLDMFAVLQQAAGTADPATQGMPAQEAPANEPSTDDWIL